MIQSEAHSETRQHILKAALKRFAHSGYAATSVQQIVSDAKVSKPTMYYYFKDKAALFQALVSEAHDEKYLLMTEAAAGAKDLKGQLTAILAALFEYFRQNRELMRISFATLYAAPGEVPEGLNYADRCERNFEFVRSLMKAAAKRGEVNSGFDSLELTLGFYGQTHAYLTGHLLMADWRPDHRTAARIAELFLAGAAAARKRKH